MTTLKSCVKRFCVAWHNSVELRIKAAQIYAKAVNEWSTVAKDVFRNLEEFKNWTPMQWRLLYYIGSEAIPKCYLDFKNPTIPLAMRRRGVSITEMEHVFEKGLFCADINGKVRCLKLRSVQEKHISQVWDEKGHKRTILQQLKWIQDNQNSNFDVLPNGVILVHHKCYITPELLAGLISVMPQEARDTLAEKAGF